MPFHDMIIDNVVVRLASKMLNSYGNILDVGCGYGLFGYKLRTEGKFVGSM
ncbi:MAG: hypothetical protein QW279_04575 [Candidatus Jordarchaeaceae archaeon]